MTAANDEQYSDAPKHCSRSFLSSGVENCNDTIDFLGFDGSWIRRPLGRTSRGSIAMKRAVSKGPQRVQALKSQLLIDGIAIDHRSAFLRARF